MKKWMLFGLSLIALSASLVLSACGPKEESGTTTGTGGTTTQPATGGETGTQPATGGETGTQPATGGETGTQPATGGESGGGSGGH